MKIIIIKMELNQFYKINDLFIYIENINNNRYYTLLLYIKLDESLFF